jgi:hypothetical protein
MIARALTATALALALSSCATWGPSWSEVTGSTAYSRTQIDTAPTLVNAIDGGNPGPRVGYYGGYKIEPGKHTFELQAAPLSAGWRGGTELQNLTLDVAPCKRYFIVGKYENRLGMQWQPQISYVEDIAGCQLASR